MSKEKKERNAEIVRLKNEGNTFRSLAKQFGLAPQRVQFIYYREEEKKGEKE